MKIEMKNIMKSFGKVKVLNNASFSLADGEIHALMGENGAGKSTLMKVLTGVYSKDAGEIFVDEKSISFNHPKEAEEYGIVFIYQELNSLLDMTVEENIFLGKEIYTKFGILDKKTMQNKVKETLSILGMNLNPNDKLSDLSVGQRQMVEIARALISEIKVIIMDEPTAALTINETEHLFKIINSLREKGVSIIYISHRMEEIFELCDRITIMRDGEYVGTKNIKDTNMNEIINMMIGRDIGDRFSKTDNEKKGIALNIKELSSGKYFNNVSFNVSYGEILGVYGLMGAGRTEIMKTIFGVLPLDSGEIELDGNRVSIKNPKEAIKNGIGFITEDRKVEGLMLNETIKNNISLNNFQRIVRNNFIISKQKETFTSSFAVRDFNIKCSGINHICNNLSGGNQQKVIFAKWILSKPKILILDEPTRGVDIASKKEIYTMMNDLASKGLAMIMVSSELPEIIGMSDRVMVIHEGKVAGFLDRSQATEKNIMILATGGQL
ncbi:sugar ABC transporter ATP-binding protein [Brachyspira pilosicoli]|uniref:sugar ABC transporter ATP-binding protein n=1 Tax=Brachyspira pilosicoli TaxID=52584 RepID=UPI003007CD42